MRRTPPKPEFFVIALLVLLAAASVCEVFYINRTIDDVQSALFAVTEASLSGNDAEDALLSLKELWAKKRRVLALIMEHSEIDNVDESLISLAAAVRSDNAEGVWESAARLEHYLSHAVTLTDPALQNIF